ncbi:hypothetical protein [Limosilactobacillus balticus]|nr:hypothetical protein [Limosilactobacillus balticus]MCD7131418.1 hypothetical protein [Limosilactobacillus balticus]
MLLKAGASLKEVQIRLRHISLILRPSNRP